MDAVNKVLLTLNRTPRLLRYAAFILISRWFLSSTWRERISKNRFTNFALGDSDDLNKAQNQELVKQAPPKHWFASLFLGNFADIAPWRNPDFLTRILEYRFQWYETLKDKLSVRVKLVQDDFVFTQDLELINAISGKEDRLFRNSDTIRKAWGVLFPDSIVVKTGDQWKRLRRVLVRALNNLDYDLVPASTSVVLELGMKKYITQPSQEVFLFDCFSKVTFDSFHKFTYDIEFNTVSGQNLQVLSDLMTIATGVSDRLLVSIPLIWYLPLESNRKLYSAQKRLYSFVDSFVAKRTEAFNRGEFDASNAKNLLDGLIVAAHQDDKFNRKQLSKGELRAQLCAAMFGGFDTTTSSISLICMNLSLHPEVQQKLWEEVKDIDLSSGKVSGTQLANLPYLNSVIKESLRMNSVAPVIARIPNQDIVVKGNLFKAGTNILADHEALGLRKDCWRGMEDLQQFRPERWLEAEPLAGAFFPFGFGGRTCPGMRIATAQLRTILTYLAQNYIILPGQKPVSFSASLGRTVSRDSTLVFEQREH